MMKCVYILSLLALASARPQYYYEPAPTSGPVYYKPINPNFYYPGYLQGQFRSARQNEEAVATVEEAPAAEEVVAVAPVAEEREGRSEEAAAPVYTTAAPPPPPPAPVYTTAAPPPPPPPPVYTTAAPPPPPPPPVYHPAPEPAYGPAAYSFEWLVKDDYTKNDYGHKESRTGKNAQGSYHVALPDGRIQTVTYGVDGYGGYIAEVSYSGEAQYPDTPAYAPAYKPAPAPAPAPYKPAPAPAPYKPAPAPAPYKPAPAPVYPVQPAASVRKYSFRHLPAVKEVEVAAEEARTGEGVEVVIDEEPIVAVAPVEEAPVVEEAARSGDGAPILIEEQPIAAVAPIEVEPVIEEAERSGDGIAIVVDEPAPIEEEIVVEESARSSGEGPAVVIEPITPVEEVPIAAVEQVDAKIEEPIVEAPREQKSLPEAAEQIVEDDAPAIVEEPVAPVAPSSYRYYYRY